MTFLKVFVLRVFVSALNLILTMKGAENMTGYDVIGDIHGQADKLEALLRTLGYHHTNGAWRHADRMALFCGDLIDRGPESVRTVNIVRSMIDAGTTRCIMGNHEYNAVCFFTPKPGAPGEFLRKNFSDKNRRQHGAFLREVGYRTPLHEELVEWFKTLPLWLELDEVCLVHACWSERAIAFLTPMMEQPGVLPMELYPDSARKGTPVCDAVKELCKGPELTVAESFLDKDGTARSKARICWWRENLPGRRIWTMRDGGTEALSEVLEPLEQTWPVRKPVFFGHYWLNPDAPKTPKSPLAACLDYSAGKGGPLVCYRFDSGDTELVPEKFVAVRE